MSSKGRFALGSSPDKLLPYDAVLSRPVRRATLITPPGSSGFECLALGRDALQQFIPGLDERSRSFSLKLVAQILDTNAGLVELGQQLVALAGTRRDSPRAWCSR
jgi:hypothetical protein